MSDVDMSNTLLGGKIIFFFSRKGKVSSFSFMGWDSICYGFLCFPLILNFFEYLDGLLEATLSPANPIAEATQDDHTADGPISNVYLAGWHNNWHCNSVRQVNTLSLY